jgi:antitoxin VapB
MEDRGDRAKVFKHGGSQAVRLPKQYRFERQREVRIHREGDRVILEPIRRPWSPAFLRLAGSAPDFPYPEKPEEADEGPEFE